MSLITTIVCDRCFDLEYSNKFEQPRADQLKDNQRPAGKYEHVCRDCQQEIKEQLSLIKK